MINSWVRGKSWWVYVGLTALFGYWAFKLRSYPDFTIPFTDVANLGIHEIGHELFRALGEFMHAAGGTITEVGIPLAFAGILLKRGWLFSGLACLMWVSTALRGAAIYAGDSVDQNLILINIQGELSSGGSDQVGHDWRFMLTELGILKHDKTVESILNGMAFALTIFVVVFGLYLIWRIKQGYKAEVPQETSVVLPGSVHEHPVEKVETVYRSDPVGYKKSDKL